ncbi:hypothetical protein LINPERHAP1_LOCUS14582 [Linum perenne]
MASSKSLCFFFPLIIIVSFSSIEVGMVARQLSHIPTLPLPPLPKPTLPLPPLSKPTLPLPPLPTLPLPPLPTLPLPPLPRNLPKIPTIPITIPVSPRLLPPKIKLQFYTTISL